MRQFSSDGQGAVDEKQQQPQTSEEAGEMKKKEPAGATLIEKETAQTGSVGWEVYRYYLQAVGVPGVILVIAMQVTFQVSIVIYTSDRLCTSIREWFQVISVGTNVWLEVWTDNELGNSSDPHYRNLYLGVYGAFGFGQAVSTLILYVALAVTTINASKLMHRVMLSTVMQSPMSFFDTTPVGRVVNRFAKDVDVCDNTLPQNLRSWLSTLASFIGTVILIIVKLPIFTAVIVPIGVVFYFIQNIYVSTSRQLKRLESISRSPIYSHFGESLSGAATIRAFGLQHKFIRQSEEKVDSNQVW